MSYIWTSEKVTQDNDGWYYKITDAYGTLTEKQKQNNALLVYAYFYDKMTLEAIAGLLGNMDKEGQLNPGQVEGGKGGITNVTCGHGLIQWTKAKNDPPNTNPLINWKNASENNLWASGEFQCYRIWCEGEAVEGAGGCWLKASDKGYTYTWKEFCELSDYKEATKAYMYERERAAIGDETGRLNYAEKWYKFLLKNTRVSVQSTSQYDTYYRHGIHKGPLTNENKNFLLTPRLPLYLFSNTHTKSGTSYAYSDKTVELLDQLIITYRGAIRSSDLDEDPNMSLSIIVTSSYRPNDSGMHGKGGAIDIGFYGKDGNLLDCRYIAIAAAKLGFSGIAPLHGNNSLSGSTTIIHLDTRADFVNAGGYFSNKKFYGYELDPDGDGWYDAFNISPATDHQEFYEITDDEILAYLGKPFGAVVLAPPRVYDLQLISADTEDADFSVTVTGEKITSIFYTLSDDTQNTQETLGIQTGQFIFSAINCIPNTDYIITVTAVNAAGATTSPKLAFKTKQDYPDPIKNITINAEKYHESSSFTVNITPPERWGYWKDKAKNDYGYRVFLVDNCLLSDYYDMKNDNIQNSFKEKPVDYLIGHAHNFQVGVSTWVTDHRITDAEEQKVFALEGHKEYPICSNSICLKELDEMSDNYYLLTKNILSKSEINRLQAYDRKTGKPLNVFILKDL